MAQTRQKAQPDQAGHRASAPRSKSGRKGKGSAWMKVLAVFPSTYKHLKTASIKSGPRLKWVYDITLRQIGTDAEH